MHPPIKLYRADLHIHTALSPCASEEMTPPAIVWAALRMGLDMIAVADHNSAGNVTAVQQAALAAGGALTVIAAMEITSREEAHVLGVFPDAAAAEGVSHHLRGLLPELGEHYRSYFGDQFVMDATGAVIGRETAALAFATPLDLNDTVELIHGAGGLAIAAHVDRKTFSVLSQLGFFPTDAGFDGVEVSRHIKSDSPRLEEFAAFDLPLTGSSDSHFLEEIGTASTDLRLADPTFAEIALAFAGAEDRSVTRA